MAAIRAILKSHARLLLITLMALAGIVHSHRANAQIPCSYEVTAVIEGPPAFGTPSPTGGLAISPNGQYVVGYYTPGAIGNDKAFVYDTTTQTFTTLPLGPGFYDAYAADVTDSGLICGTGDKTSIGQRAFVYDLNTGQWTELPPIDPAAGWSGANAINADGVVCGFRSIASSVNPQTAYLWSAKAGFKDLGVMDGPSSGASAISDSGTVVGWTGHTYFSNDARGFLYQDGKITILDPIPSGINSSAKGLNNQGQFLVQGEVVPLVGQSYVWDQGKLTLIQPLSGYDGVGVSRISDSGIVTGRSFISGGNASDWRACIWQETVVHDLNEMLGSSPAVYLNTAVDMSIDGWILASGSNAKVNVVAVLLTPHLRQSGDTNCDEIINVDDLLNVINDWGICPACPTDFTKDGTVDLQDLIMVLVNWSF